MRLVTCHWITYIFHADNTRSIYLIKHSMLALKYIIY
uniref:Uncharacterized protein n=1 Tax=Arundo donax TaxID=35708 RepID=A0A0A9AZ26_ARUDO